jgi:hypothetical protein
MLRLHQWSLHVIEAVSNHISEEGAGVAGIYMRLSLRPSEGSADTGPIIAGSQIK